MKKFALNYYKAGKHLLFQFYYYLKTVVNFSALGTSLNTTALLPSKEAALMVLIPIALLFTPTSLTAQTITQPSGAGTNTANVNCNAIVPGTASAPSATFVDNGGAGGNYQTNSSSVQTICSNDPGNVYIKVFFNSFSLDPTTGGACGAQADFLRVYNGNSTAAPLLSSETNTGLIGVGVFATAAGDGSGCLTFQFFSGSGCQSTGWDADVTCFYPCANPIASFTPNAPIEICRGDAVNYDASSSTVGVYGGGAPAFSLDSYEWTFGDGTTATGVTPPPHTYNFGGGYYVALSVTDDNVDGDATGDGCRNVNANRELVKVSQTPNFAGTSATADYMCVGDPPVNITGTVTGRTWVETRLPTPIPESFIPDGGAPLELPVVIDLFNQGDTYSSGDLQDITINIEHTYTGDLTISVISPNGTEVVLFSGGGSAGTFGTPSSDDCNASSGSTVCTPSIACITDPSCNPAGTGADQVYTAGVGGTSLNDFVGDDLNGTWKIKIADGFAIDNGWVFNGLINFNAASQPPLATFTNTYTLASSTETTWNADPTITSTSADGDVIGVQPLTPGDYTYTYTVTDDFGCTFEQQYTITVLDNDPGSAVLGTGVTSAVLCCNETITLDNTTAAYDGVLAADNPNRDYEMGYAITTATAGPAASQADLDALTLNTTLYKANANDGTDNSFDLSTDCLNLPAGEYLATPFVSVEEIKEIGSFNDLTIAQDPFPGQFQAYINDYTSEGSLNDLAINATSASTLSITVNSSYAIACLGGFYIDIYKSGTYITTYGLGNTVTTSNPYLFGDTPTLVLNPADLGGLTSNDDLRVVVALASSASCPAAFDPLAAVDNGNFNVDYDIDYNLSFGGPTNDIFPDLDEGGCTSFGAPITFYITSDIDPGTASLTADCNNSTYDAVFTPTNGAVSLSGNPLNAVYEVADANAVSIVFSSPGTDPNTGTGAVTITYNIGTAYNANVYNYENGVGRIASQNAPSGCPQNIAGASTPVAAAPSSTTPYEICAGLTIPAGEGLEATCGAGQGNVVWYEDMTTMTVAGTGSPFAPATYTGTNIEDLAPGTYTFYVACSGSGNTCPGPRTAVDLVIKDVPQASFTCPTATLGQCSGEFDLLPIDNNIATSASSTGTFSGTAAAFVIGDTNPGGDATFDPINMPTGVLLTLTYDLIDNGCTNSFTCSFTIIKDKQSSAGGY